MIYFPRIDFYFFSSYKPIKKCLSFYLSFWYTFSPEKSLQISFYFRGPTHIINGQVIA